MHPVSDGPLFCHRLGRMRHLCRAVLPTIFRIPRDNVRAMQCNPRHPMQLERDSGDFHPDGRSLASLAGDR
eukprot:1154995-Prymnesium_polylepis.1